MSKNGKMKSRSNCLENHLKSGAKDIARTSSKLQPHQRSSKRTEDEEIGMLDTINKKLLGPEEDAAQSQEAKGMQA
jgi:hypothetical protein